MEWSSKFDLHIHCVLHLNKGDNNVRKHIGTVRRCNKAETVLVIAKQENPAISEVHAFAYLREGVPAFRLYRQRRRPRSSSRENHLLDSGGAEAPRTGFMTRPSSNTGKPFPPGEAIKARERAVGHDGNSYEAIGFKRGRSVSDKNRCNTRPTTSNWLIKRDKLYYDVTPTEAMLFDEK